MPVVVALGWSVEETETYHLKCLIRLLYCSILLRRFFFDRIYLNSP
jgi:hypothetical protein